MKTGAQLLGEERARNAARIIARANLKFVPHSRYFMVRCNETSTSSRAGRMPAVGRSAEPSGSSVRPRTTVAGPESGRRTNHVPAHAGQPRMVQPAG